ncbi:hypothetical protein GCM10009788_16170 [Nocardioides humi]|jgi:hypothetical protein|uniref:Uncharacterized protein n=1 Tax=Nocardioides humi TaxID=449461 RepID=A0ABN2A7E1_9ACTN
MASDSGTSATRTVADPSEERAVTRPLGSTTAEIPFVDATATLRLSSTARARVISNCCSGWDVPKKVALLVCTVTSCAPRLT